MALDATRLKTAILTRMKAHYRAEAPSNRVNDENYWLDVYFQIISEELISEITTNARLTGNDSDGDSLPAVRIE
jgi:hypothetical protein